MTEQRRVGLYLRVSTAEQSTELQARDIHQYLGARQWADVTTYEDSGATGTNSNRPALKGLLDDVRQGKVTTVVVWKLDRLFRSLKDLILTLQEFSERGVEFISLKDNIDLSTSAGRLMVHLLGAFAQFEADLIRERVKAGLSNAKAKGTRLGRPTEINALKAFELRAEGWSLGKIARYLGVSKSGVHKILSKNPDTKPFTKLDSIGSKNRPLT